jgi:hypothetical protein
MLKCSDQGISRLMEICNHSHFGLTFYTSFIIYRRLVYGYNGNEPNFKPFSDFSNALISFISIHPFVLCPSPLVET